MEPHYWPQKFGNCISSGDGPPEGTPLKNLSFPPLGAE